MPHQNTSSSSATAQNAATDPAAPRDQATDQDRKEEPRSYAASDVSDSSLAPAPGFSPRPAAPPRRWRGVRLYGRRGGPGRRSRSAGRQSREPAPPYRGHGFSGPQDQGR